MTFQPIIPFSGLAGWQFLQRTVDHQKAAFEESLPIKRATENFRDRIGEVTSVDDLMEDRELLQVALGAFGLDEDINNKFFIQKVLEEGSFDPGSLGNRLADKSYLSFAQFFGFGDIGGAGLTTRPGFADDLIERYEQRQFEIAVGEQDDTMRLAMNFATELQDVVDDTSTENGRWYSIFGSTSLRNVVQAGLGLPSSIASIDIDQQLTIFKEKAQKVFGTTDPADFLTEDAQEQMIRLFLVRSEAESASNVTGASIAITLLQSIA